MLTSDSLSPKPSVLFGIFAGHFLAMLGIVILLGNGGR